MLAVVALIFVKQKLRNILKSVRAPHYESVYIFTHFLFYSEKKIKKRKKEHEGWYKTQENYLTAPIIKKFKKSNYCIINLEKQFFNYWSNWILNHLNVLQTAKLD